MGGGATSSGSRAHVDGETRRRVIGRIMETLRKQFKVMEPDNMDDLRNLAVRFEEKTFTTAINQADYLDRISMKMHTIESMAQNASNANQRLSNPAGQIPGTPVGSHVLHSQMQNVAQSRQVLLTNQAQQQTLAQGIQNNIISTAVQDSASFASAISSMNGLSQSNMPNHLVNHLEQSMPHDIYANQNQGRPQQQPIIYQQHQQQSLNPQLYPQQFEQQQETSKAKLSHASLLQSPDQQQQPLLSTMHIQSSQGSLMELSSSLQSSQSNLQQTQPPLIQSVLKSELKQSQPNMLEQLPLRKPHSQAVSRQLKPSQTSTVHQQASSLQQQPIPISQPLLLTQQQQHRQQHLGHQLNITNMQQNHIVGQKNNIPDKQHPQYKLTGQQSLMNVQMPSQINTSLHQWVVSQSSTSGLHSESQQQMQQSHMLGSQPNITNVQQYQQAMHVMQPQKPSPQQQPTQQGLQLSGGLLHPQNAIEQQKLHQAQRRILEASPTLKGTTSQTSQVVSDWQEETYQKIQSMKELYNADLAELHLKIAQKWQEHDALISSGKLSEKLENFKKVKMFLDHLVLLFRIPKIDIQPAVKEKLPYYEEQLLGMALNRRKNSSQLQGGQQISHSAGDAQFMSWQPPTQVPPIQQQGNHVKKMPSLGVQGSVTSRQSAVVSSVCSGSMSLSKHVGVSITPQNIRSPLQSCPSSDSSQGGSFTSLRQEVMDTSQQVHVGSLHQPSISSSPQTTMNTLAQTNNATSPNLGTHQPNVNVLQQQHVKEDHQHHQQLMHPKQIKLQMQQCQMQQWTPQILQQQSAQFPAQQMTQLHQTDTNHLKARQGSNIKSRFFQSNFPTGQHQTYPHQQLKPGDSLTISSPKNFEAPSPQISQHSSPQVDEGLLSSLPKAVKPLQSTGSPSVSSPSTLASSPLPGDHDKQECDISSPINVENIGHQQTSMASSQVQLLAFGTPGISASPLLAEYTSADAVLQNAQAVLPCKSIATERPAEHLAKLVQLLPLKVIASSVSDICSVVSMIDTIAGSVHGNGSRSIVGEDLAAMTKCRLQARNFMLQEGSGAIGKRMKRRISAMPLTSLLPAGHANENEQSTRDLTVSASQPKRQKVEANYLILDEIKWINQRLIDTVVNISDEDSDSVTAAAEGEGTVVKCSYCPVAVCPSLKSLLASAKVTPILPLRLLIPVSYPNCSPILLDKMPVELSKESEDLSAKARLMFGRSLRVLPEPMSLRDIVRTWDTCTRKVIEEYSLQYGGGSFSSKYGCWERCVTA